MRHAHDDFLYTCGTGVLQQFVQHRDQAFIAFAGKTFLADVAGMQVLLQPFGCGQTFENMTLVFRSETGLRADGFQPVLQPALLFHIGNVHVFNADAAAVGLLQSVQNFPQGGVFRANQRTGMEHLVHIRIGKSVEFRIQFGNILLLLQVERIKIGPAHTQKPVSVDQLQHSNLLAFLHLKIGCLLFCPPWRGSGGVRLMLRGLDQRFNHRGVRDIAGGNGFCGLQRIEIQTPLIRNAGLIFQILVVEHFDKCCIGAKQF